ncbi:MAG: toprim domain-containing protein [Mycoplasmataceae bacterium]|nr:toprim domain-containing protein [Mycoplasmataceae bacterium]
MENSKSLQHLIDLFSTLPQVSKKQAKNIALFLIKKDENHIDEFTKQIKDAKKKLHFCEQCNCLSEKNICEICSDYKRDLNSLCIISTSEDLDKIENTGAFKGTYFVLNSELDSKKSNSFNEELLNKLDFLIKLNKPQNIIFATNWTINGEYTSSVLRTYIQQKHNYKINFFRLAVGLPVNSCIDYADNFTLKYAIENKTKY